MASMKILLQFWSILFFALSCTAVSRNGKDRCGERVKNENPLTWEEYCDTGGATCDSFYRGETRCKCKELTLTVNSINRYGVKETIHRNQPQWDDILEKCKPQRGCFDPVDNFTSWHAFCTSKGGYCKDVKKDGLQCRCLNSVYQKWEPETKTCVSQVNDPCLANKDSATWREFCEAGHGTCMVDMRNTTKCACIHGDMTWNENENRCVFRDPCLKMVNQFENGKSFCAKSGKICLSFEGGSVTCGCPTSTVWNEWSGRCISEKDDSCKNKTILGDKTGYEFCQNIGLMCTENKNGRIKCQCLKGKVYNQLHRKCVTIKEHMCTSFRENVKMTGDDFCQTGGATCDAYENPNTMICKCDTPDAIWDLKTKKCVLRGQIGTNSETVPCNEQISSENPLTWHQFCKNVGAKCFTSSHQGVYCSCNPNSLMLRRFYASGASDYRRIHTSDTYWDDVLEKCMPKEHCFRPVDNFTSWHKLCMNRGGYCDDKNSTTGLKCQCLNKNQDWDSDSKKCVSRESDPCLQMKNAETWKGFCESGDGTCNVDKNGDPKCVCLHGEKIWNSEESKCIYEDSCLNKVDLAKNGHVFCKERGGEKCLKNEGKMVKCDCGTSKVWDEKTETCVSAKEYYCPLFVEKVKMTGDAFCQTGGAVCDVNPSTEAIQCRCNSTEEYWNLQIKKCESKGNENMN